MQHEWVNARKSFGGERRHHLLESDGDIIGYCAIELSDRDAGRSFRAFVVTDWREGPDNAAILYQQVLDDLRTVGATHAWMREYASDAPLISFFRERGFGVGEPFERGSERFVILRKAL